MATKEKRTTAQLYIPATADAAFNLRVRTRYKRMFEAAARALNRNRSVGGVEPPTGETGGGLMVLVGTGNLQAYMDRQGVPRADFDAAKFLDLPDGMPAARAKHNKAVRKRAAQRA